MGYLTAKQFSEKWGISERRIIKLCSENRIDGAVKNGMVWLMPEDTMKPSDKRSKISKYINTQKRIMIMNIENYISIPLIELLKKQGYVIDGICNEGTILSDKLQSIDIYKYSKNNIQNIIKDTSKYYSGLIYIEEEDTKKLIGNSSKELIIREFAKKMDSEGSIVLVNKKIDTKIKLETKLANELKQDIGIRINALNINIPNGNVIINYNEIVEDIVSLITKFKNTTGTSIVTDGGYIEFNKDGITEGLETGEFYRAINYYFKNLTKESHLWCVSTMLEDEWTEEPLEMQFRVTNLEMANRGVKIDRIFIFSKSKIKEFKNNKTLQIYMQSSINTMFVDYDEISKKEPELLEIVSSGWDGINKEVLIVDLLEGNQKRGYISINKEKVSRAYECFRRIKEYAIDLKEILK